MSASVETDYVPSEDEPFMNERQKAYFRSKLVSWKSEILREARETLEILQRENANLPDLADLDARPIATLSIEAQERHERREKVYRDD
jgi:DnaK suppressor protein